MRRKFCILNYRGRTIGEDDHWYLDGDKDDKGLEFLYAFAELIQSGEQLLRKDKDHESKDDQVEP